MTSMTESVSMEDWKDQGIEIYPYLFPVCAVVIADSLGPEVQTDTYDSDPAFSPFIGPLAVPRTHEYRAALLRQNYRSAPPETGDYIDIPEDAL